MPSPTARLWTRDYLLVTLVNLLTSLNFYLLMVVVADYAMRRFGASPGQAGLAASIFILGALLARMAAGRWMAVSGPGRVLLAGTAAGLALTLLYLPARNLPALMAVRLLHGAAFGIVTTATATAVAGIIPAQRKGEGIGYFSLSQTFATAAGPFIGLVLARSGRFEALFVLCALVSAAAIVLVPAMTPARRAAGAGPAPRPGGLLEPRVLPVASVNLVFTFCYSGVVSFLAAYAREIHLAAAASLFFLVYAGVVVLSRPMVGKQLDRKGADWVMYPACLALALGVALFSQCRSGAVLLLSAVFMALGIGAIQVATQTLVVKLSPPDRLPQANATYFLCMDVGMAIGPMVVGALVPGLGFRGMYLAVAALALAGMGHYRWVHGGPVRRAGRDLPAVLDDLEDGPA
jgi:MFS family permease